jgi:hypothetical protein
VAIEGILTSPSQHNVPGVRKKIPTPFSRPRIDLDGGKRVKREWQDVAAHQLRKGDTIAGFGTVAADPVEFIRTPKLGQTEGDVDWRIRLYNVMGEYRDYHGQHRMFAFAAESCVD